MTMREAILARSPLPKDGTHTMKEHTLAAEMTIYGHYIVTDVQVSADATDVRSSANEVIVVSENSDNNAVVTDTVTVVDTKKINNEVQ